MRCSFFPARLEWFEVTGPVPWPLCFLSFGNMEGDELIPFLIENAAVTLFLPFLVLQMMAFPPLLFRRRHGVVNTVLLQLALLHFPLEEVEN